MSPHHHPEAHAMIEALGLVAHPEGGYFRETFRSELGVRDGALREPGPAPIRPASTAIYFLLPAGECSAFHRLRSEEVWHHYAGDPLELHTIDEDGVASMTTLGGDVASGERPQQAVPAGVWQAARVAGDRYALCGCTVAPAFEYAGFELARRADLIERYPGHAAIIEALTRG